MATIILKNIVKDTSSETQGLILYDFLNNAHKEDLQVILNVDADLTLSSSFLNASIGLFLDNYGFEVFKEMIKLQTSKNQFSRISSYIQKYREVYLTA